MDEILKQEHLLLKVEFVELVRRETISWRKNVKVRWAKDGDCNSAFFHRMVTGRRSKNLLGSLEKDGGVGKKGYGNQKGKEILSFMPQR